MSQQINLFNPIFVKQKTVFSGVAMARALGVLLVGLLAMAAYGKRQLATLEQQAQAAATQLAQKQARQAMVNVEFAPRQPSKELEAQLAEADTQLRALQSVSGVLARGELGNTTGYSEYYKALARQHQSGLWLTGVTVAGGNIGIRGRALQGGMVPGYIRRLTREPVMQGKTFASLHIAQAQLKDVGGAAGVAPYIEFGLESVVQDGPK